MNTTPAVTGTVVVPADELRAAAMGRHLFTAKADGACICGAERTHRMHVHPKPRIR